MNLSSRNAIQRSSSPTPPPSPVPPPHRQPPPSSPQIMSRNRPNCSSRSCPRALGSLENLQLSPSAAPRQRVHHNPHHLFSLATITTSTHRLRHVHQLRPRSSMGDTTTSTPTLGVSSRASTNWRRLMSRMEGRIEWRCGDPFRSHRSATRGGGITRLERTPALDQ